MSSLPVDSSSALLEATITSLQQLLKDRTVAAEAALDLQRIAGFSELYQTLLEIRNAIMASASGDLSFPVKKKGYVPGAIKALQASLQHLTWQTKAIATGDFSQRVDFMGDFSIAFNSMVSQLDETMRNLTIVNARLEASQTRIMESLTCARVIQASILPGQELFDRLFSGWFTLYKPCDVVGGDLYWLGEYEGRTLLAIIDCTGHGVPGAFMTMTVNSVLNHLAGSLSPDDPARILQEMNRVLQETLHLRQASGSMVDAGLDIILCSIDPRKKQLTFAGAGLSLHVLHNGCLHEIRGDRPGVGYSGNDPTFCYSNHPIEIEAGTVFYATTDGFLDDSGGAKGYGFGRERFKEMLMNQAGQPLDRQGELFWQKLCAWRGDRRQRDDITLLGFRV